ncbi:hypothetical protein [Peribacillus frigoritolerans]
MDYRENAPTSISYDLHTNIIKHRWWRDRFNWDRQEARNRLNIPLETTIFLLIAEINNNTTRKLEELLNQTYHYYQLFILDLTQNFQTTLNTLKVNDSRIVIIPTEKFKSKLKVEITAVKTPFVIYIAEDTFPSTIYALEILVKSLKNATALNNSKLFPSYYSNNYPHLRKSETMKNWNYNELYPSEILKRFYQGGI